MFEIEVDGETWRYAFVEPDAILSFEDREHLVAETARLYHSGRRHKMIKGKGFEGRIAKGKYFC